MNFFTDLLGGFGSALGGVASVLGVTSGKKNKFDYNASEWQYQKQRELNQQQFELQNQANINMYNLQQQGNIDLWNMQNAYNTPSAQMQRLKDAGLNPNLVYGSIGSGNASSISPATLSSARYGDVNVSQPTLLSRNKRKEIANLMLSSARFFTELSLREKMLDLQRKGLENETQRITNDGIRLSNDTKRVDLLESERPFKEQMYLQNIVNRKLDNYWNGYKLNYQQWYDSLPWYQKIWHKSPGKVIGTGIGLGAKFFGL